MEHGAFLKLSFFVVILVAFTSYFSPHIAEAHQMKPVHQSENNHQPKGNQHANKGHRRNKFSPLAPTPTTAPPPPPPPRIHDDLFPPPPPRIHDDLFPPPPPIHPPSLVEPPAFRTPATAPSIGMPPALPPFPADGIRYLCGEGPCGNFEYCNAPCPVCCANRTCCADNGIDY